MARILFHINLGIILVVALGCHSETKKSSKIQRENGKKIVKNLNDESQPINVPFGEYWDSLKVKPVKYGCHVVGGSGSIEIVLEFSKEKRLLCFVSETEMITGWGSVSKDTGWPELFHLGELGIQSRAVDGGVGVKNGQ